MPLQEVSLSMSLNDSITRPEEESQLQSTGLEFCSATAPSWLHLVLSRSRSLIPRLSLDLGC